MQESGSSRDPIDNMDPTEAYAITRAEINEIERVRRALWDLTETDPSLTMRFANVTSTLWQFTHKRREQLTQNSEEHF